MTLSDGADMAAVLAGIVSWRISRACAIALLLGAASSMAHAITHAEELRLVSALIGLCGLLVFARGAIACRASAWSARQALRQLDRAAWIGLLLVASFAMDFGALCAWRMAAEWVQPITQILVCALIMLIGLWPGSTPLWLGSLRLDLPAQEERCLRVLCSGIT